MSREKSNRAKAMQIRGRVIKFIFSTDVKFLSWSRLQISGELLVVGSFWWPDLLPQLKFRHSFEIIGEWN